ncbi:MAG: response regulator [Armatimonadota bacterium]
MNTSEDRKPVGLLLVVEDTKADVRLLKESFRESGVMVESTVVEDGEEAMAYLLRRGRFNNAPRPDMVLLDLNLPRKDGREVLLEIKSDPQLKSIPVVILTTSTAEEDVVECYDLGANCYVVKPIDLDEYIRATRALAEFWFTVAKYPET